MPAKRIKRGRTLRNSHGRLVAESDRLFLPDHLEQVRAIAMRGLSDVEIGELFGISTHQIGTWKRQFPMFKRALEEGRTDADAAVLAALYQKAVGYTHDEEKIFQWDGEIVRADTVKHYAPDTNAIKLWLTNRQRDHWQDRQRTEHTGKDDGPIGIRNETKEELANSILGLLQPKPDTVTFDNETGKPVDETPADKPRR